MCKNKHFAEYRKIYFTVFAKYRKIYFAVFAEYRKICFAVFAEYRKIFQPNSTTKHSQTPQQNRHFPAEFHKKSAFLSQTPQQISAKRHNKSQPKATKFLENSSPQTRNLLWRY